MTANKKIKWQNFQTDGTPGKLNMIKIIISSVSICTLFMQELLRLY